MNSKGFWVDFPDKIVWVNKEFLEAAADEFTNEYKTYLWLQRYYPDYQITGIEKEQ